jgi:hypothetical protein
MSILLGCFSRNEPSFPGVRLSCISDTYRQSSQQANGPYRTFSPVLRPLPRLLLRPLPLLASPSPHSAVPALSGLPVHLQLLLLVSTGVSVCFCFSPDRQPVTTWKSPQDSLISGQALPRPSTSSGTHVAHVVLWGGLSANVPPVPSGKGRLDKNVCSLPVSPFSAAMFS